MTFSCVGIISCTPVPGCWSVKSNPDQYITVPRKKGNGKEKPQIKHLKNKRAISSAVAGTQGSTDQAATAAGSLHSSIKQQSR